MAASAGRRGSKTATATRRSEARVPELLQEFILLGCLGADFEEKLTGRDHVAVGAVRRHQHSAPRLQIPDRGRQHVSRGCVARRRTTPPVKIGGAGSYPGPPSASIGLCCSVSLAGTRLACPWPSSDSGHNPVQ